MYRHGAPGGVDTAVIGDFRRSSTILGKIAPKKLLQRLSIVSLISLICYGYMRAEILPQN